MVKSCPKLEAGLRLGQEGIHACQAGPFSSPIYWTAEEAAGLQITREMIAAKRRWIFDLLNDPRADTPCKHCHRVVLKHAEDVRFDLLGHIDLAATTTCNLRCNFCGYSREDSFAEAKYDALAVLNQYAPQEILWDAAVDFNGGEPTLLEDFDDYVEYFRTRRIRVFLYSNALAFRASVADGLNAGTIRWLCTSLDAGTAATFARTKRSPRFEDVLANLSRYARAGEAGMGQLAVKYIFTQDNCGGDDIKGFCEAMTRVRPQEVWLTFDFMPLANIPGDSADFGGYDYRPLIAAYARTWIELNGRGLTTVHFYEKHLANDSLQGKRLLQAAKDEIVRQGWAPPSAMRRTALNEVPVAGKRVVLAPASAQSRTLLGRAEIAEAQVVGYCDRDAVLHGKTIGGITVHPYAHLRDLAPDIVLVSAPEQHANALMEAVTRHLPADGTAVLLLP